MDNQLFDFSTWYGRADAFGFLCFLVTVCMATSFVVNGVIEKISNRSRLGIVILAFVCCCLLSAWIWLFFGAPQLRVAILITHK